MAIINVLDVADTAILTIGASITDRHLVPFPSGWDDSASPQVWEGGTIDETYEVGRDTYRVTFSYDEEIGFVAGNESLYITGRALSDDEDDNGSMTSFAAYNGDYSMLFVSKDPVSEQTLLGHLDAGEEITPEVLSGDDLILIAGPGVTVLAQDGNDTVIGGAGADGIWGDAGHDVISGNKGNDTVVAGAGNDTLSGGAGNDSIWGMGGKDNISGGRGADLLVGNAGKDRVLGQGGNDTLYGSAGRDALIGGKGDDFLTGGKHADKFIFAGRAGNDTITDFSDDDILVFRKNAEGASDISVQQQGTDVLIDYGKGTILLWDIAVDDISLDDHMSFL